MVETSHPQGHRNIGEILKSKDISGSLGFVVSTFGMLMPAPGALFVKGIQLLGMEVCSPVIYSKVYCSGGGRDQEVPLEKYRI